MVKLELNLPWKPVLAWPWGVTYIIDPDTFLVTKHIESWDIEPWKVSKRSFTFTFYFLLVEACMVKFDCVDSLLLSRAFSRFSVVLPSKSDKSIRRWCYR